MMQEKRLLKPRRCRSALQGFLNAETFGEAKVEEKEKEDAISNHENDEQNNDGEGEKPEEKEENKEEDKEDVEDKVDENTSKEPVGTIDDSGFEDKGKQGNNEGAEEGQENKPKTEHQDSAIDSNAMEPLNPQNSCISTGGNSTDQQKRGLDKSDESLVAQLLQRQAEEAAKAILETQESDTVSQLKEKPIKNQKITSDEKYEADTEEQPAGIANPTFVEKVHVKKKGSHHHKHSSQLELVKTESNTRPSSPLRAQGVGMKSKNASQDTLVARVSGGTATRPESPRSRPLSRTSSIASQYNNKRRK